MTWSAEEITVIQASAHGDKIGLRLNKEYVLEQCVHSNESGYFLKFYVYQYSGGPLRLCKCDCEDNSTVSYSDYRGLILNHLPGLTLA